MNDGSSIDEVPSHVAMEASKWVWMLANLRCDQCAARYEASAGSLQCSNCDQKHYFSGRAINFLDQDTVEQFHIDATDNVSDHPFDGNAMAIIKRVGETGGMVLDCGSGYKSSSFPHVSCTAGTCWADDTDR